ncbi:MAG: cobyrinate a,c-diamide synthase [Thermodesulfobacteriota bacterium]
MNRNTSTIKGFVVAAPMSGSGKTTVTLALMAALKKKGLQVAPFKVGPDFIDPGHHGRVTGRISRNVDGWMLDRPECRRIFSDAAGDADIAVAEGVMGLFDGYDGTGEAGSTAEMAKWLGLPVLLVVDAKSMARSFAALVKGFVEFDPDLRFCGVLANNVGSDKHLAYLQQALAGIINVPLLGAIPRNADVTIPDRHLGLYTADDHVLPDAAVDALADMATAHMDLGAFVDHLPETAPDTPDAADTQDAPVLPAPDIGIGVARDAAFCFYYEDNLDVLRRNGCGIEFFSPITDAAPPDVDGLYFGGGYPELFAAALSENVSMRKAIQNLSASGMPVYAECGGFMYLCRKLVTADGRPYEMAGVFAFEICMQQRLAALGYREIKFVRDTPLGPAGMSVRGHEFHYSHLAEPDEAAGAVPAYGATDKSGTDRGCPGWLIHRCLGSYVHLHFKSRPAVGAGFAAACRKYKAEQELRHAAR